MQTANQPAKRLWRIRHDAPNAYEYDKFLDVGPIPDIRQGPGREGALEVRAAVQRRKIIASHRGRSQG